MLTCRISEEPFSNTARTVVDVSSSMSSWWNQTLHFLCLFACRFYLAKSGCNDFFDPTHWNINIITLSNLSETFSLVQAPTIEKMVFCSLSNGTRSIWSDCSSTTFVCEQYKESPYKVSFYDFMCLMAKAVNVTSPACTHDVVVELYQKYNITLSSHNAKMKTDLTEQKVVTVVYSALGLSLVLNLVLMFLLALLCSRRRSNHIISNHSEAHTNGDIPVKEQSTHLLQLHFTSYSKSLKNHPCAIVDTTHPGRSNADSSASYM